MKKLLTLLVLAVAFMILGACALAETTLWRYRETDAGVVVTGYLGDLSDVAVPARLDGKEVCGIDAGAFGPDVRRVEIPASVSAIADGAVAPGAKVAARFGTAALRWAEAAGLETECLSKADLTVIMADITGCEYTREAGGLLLSPALARAVADSEALYTDETETGYLIESLEIQSDGRTLARVTELDPVFVFNRLVIQSGRSNSSPLIEKSGRAVFTWTPDRIFHFPLINKTIGSDLGIFSGYKLQSSMDVSNVNIILELNTAPLFTSTALSTPGLYPVTLPAMFGYNLDKIFMGMPEECVDWFAPVFERIHIEFDADFILTLKATNQTDTHRVAVTNTEITFSPVKITMAYGFVTNIYVKASTSRMDIDKVEYRLDGYHFGVEYTNYDNQRHAENLSRSTEASMKCEQVSEFDFSIDIGAEIELCSLLSVAELSAGFNFYSRVATTETIVDDTGAVTTDYAEAGDEDDPRAMLCRDVDWDVKFSIKFTVECMLKMANLEQGAWGAAAYFQDSEDLTDNIQVGLNYGSVLGAYATFNLWEADIFFPWMISDCAIRSNQPTPTHLELTPGGWVKRNECTRDWVIVLDPDIPGTEPVVVNLAAVMDSWNYLNYEPVRPDAVFLGWFTEDGEEMENMGSTGLIEYFQDGQMRLKAHWEIRQGYRPSDNGTTTPWVDCGYTSGLPDYTCMYINGRNMSDPQEWYDTYLCTHTAEQAWYAYGEDVLARTVTCYDEETDSYYDSYVYRIAPSDFLSTSLYVRGGEYSTVTSVAYGSRVIGSDGYSYSPNLRTVTCNDGMRRIGRYRDCTALSEVRLPAGLTGIDGKTFENCRSLTSIEIPNGVETIGEYAFAGSGLISITLPDSVRKIENYAFLNCPNLETVILPKGVVLGVGAFAGCQSLRVVQGEIGAFNLDAFDGCVRLESLTLTGEKLSFGIGYHGHIGIRTLTIDVDTLVCKSYSTPVEGLERLTIRARRLEGDGGDSNLCFNQFGSLKSLAIEVDEAAGIEEIDIWDCPLLKKLTVRSDALRVLWITNGLSLETIDCTGTLDHLTIWNCPAIRELNLPAVAIGDQGYLSLRNLDALERIDFDDGTDRLPQNCIFHAVSLTTVVIPADTIVEDGAINNRDPQTGEDMGLPVTIVRRVATSIGDLPGARHALHFTSAFGPVNDDWTVPAGAQVTLFAPQRDDCAFVGWYEEGARDALYAAGDSFTMPDHDVTLWALFDADAESNF